jgi:hypothetical protein
MTALATIARKSITFLRLPPAARAEALRDRVGRLPDDPGCERVIDEGLEWLGRAQDRSRTADGGVSRHYSLYTGWGASYPETTGYIVPTMLEGARLRGRDEYRDRARRMLDWLVSIQLPCGGFQGGMIGETPVVPVTFNTGQILIGLAAGAREFGEAYRGPLRRAADWLVATQDPNGCWSRHPTPFAAPGEKAYETHVAWGLFEAERAEPGRGYGEAGLANVRWALTQQRPNGWFANCCLDEPAQPLTHTLGYVLRGVLEAYRLSGAPELLTAARRTADSLRGAIDDVGFLPGRLDPDWRGCVPWACLTGSVQVAICWQMLAAFTGDPGYHSAARAANRYVRLRVRVEGPPEVRGAVKGSFPVDGEYCRFQYPNWATKFFIDSHLIELGAVPAERGV